MLLRQIFDPDLAQYSYLIGSRQSGEALVVDPQRDIDRYLELAEEEGVRIVGVAETHIHADFLSGAREMVERTGARAYLSAEGGEDWQYTWATRGTGEIVSLHHGDRVEIGELELRVLATPGHTPEHLVFLVTDHGAAKETPLGLFAGDFLLVGDMGRPDLLELAGGAADSREASARALYRSLELLADLPDHVQIWPAHGAGSSCGKAIGALPISTVGYERRNNQALHRAGEGEEAFARAILQDQPTPPTYFGRMKRANRDGPALLGTLPSPRRSGAAEVAGALGSGERVVIDTRRDRGEFMEAHLPGAVYAPFGRSFSTAVGAMLPEADRPIVLVVQQPGLDRVVRDLVRMGYDQVVGYVAPADLVDYLRSGGEQEAIPTIGFADVRRELGSSPAAVVDVRDHFEFDAGHIPGAVNAPYTRLPEYLESRIPPGGPLVVHCESGARSAVASAWLAASGREVLYVDDDWSTWEELGGPVEGGVGKD